MKLAQGVLTESLTEVSYAEVNGTKLAYTEKGEGEAVVFLHGGLSDLRSWHEQQNLVSQYFKTFSYSRRHHYPNNQESGGEYSPAQHTADLVGFLKALGIEKAHLVGRCYGGSLALLTALQHPESVLSLILGEPVNLTGFPDEEGISLLSKQKIGFNEAIQLARKDKKEWAIRQFFNVIVGADILDQLPDHVRGVVMENTDTLEPMLNTYYDLPPISCDDLKQVAVPTLLISGEFSPRIARLNNERLKTCLPNSQAVILQGTSHGLHIENPEGFNRMLLEFLSVHQS